MLVALASGRRDRRVVGEASWWLTALKASDYIQGIPNTPNTNNKFGAGLADNRCCKLGSHRYLRLNPSLVYVFKLTAGRILVWESALGSVIEVAISLAGFSGIVAAVGRRGQDIGVKAISCY